MIVDAKFDRNIPLAAMMRPEHDQGIRSADTEALGVQ
jgi:hypothetical protein